MDKGRPIDGAIDLRNRAGKPSGDKGQEEATFADIFFILKVLVPGGKIVLWVDKYIKCSFPDLQALQPF